MISPERVGVRPKEIEGNEWRSGDTEKRGASGKVERERETEIHEGKQKERERKRTEKEASV